MKRQTIIEEFQDYYLMQNRVDSVQKLSKNLSLYSMKTFNNSIIIGNTVIDIPNNIITSFNNNNTKLDAYTNYDQDIYYVDNNLKKYYQIGEEITLSQYDISENEVLKINLKFDYNKMKDYHFIIIEFTELQGSLARKYQNLNDITLLPRTDTKYLKLFLVPENEGFVYNLNFDIKKENMTIANNISLKINSKKMYNPDSRVLMTEQDNSLFISVPELQKDFIYFSYAMDNNSFNKIPPHSLIEINNSNLYEVTTPFQLHEKVDFTPTLIEYNEKGKTNLIKLNAKSHYIRFQKDTTKVRLAYRFTGVGTVQIKPINIIEYETETEYELVDWKSRYEIDRYMKTIKRLKDLRMAVIMDEFTYHSYRYEADLLRLSFDNWKNEIISFMPHFVFIESSWHGNNGDWSKKIAYVTDEKHSYIKELISFAKSLDIPVIFWNKEDPVHFDHFIHTAKLCDFVFTTDYDRVDDYKIACNHENVDVLQFAAQPVNHNPLKIQRERIDGISFAGSYYGLREERSKDMKRLFKASIPHKLYIYDRNYNFTKKGERLNFLFPEEFRKYILGTLPFYEIEKAYKGYKFMININTVKTSPTMYARRVYEGLASGTPIISNYSYGMELQFGDIIGYSEDEVKLNEYLTFLNENDSEYNKVKQLGIRRVLSNHTYELRLLKIAKKIGYEIDKTAPNITFISFIESKKEINKSIEIFETIRYLNKKLIIIVNEEIREYSKTAEKVTILNYSRVSDFFETISQLIEADYISPLSTKDFYGENYVQDLLLASLYSNADIIGKNNFYYYDEKQLIEMNKETEHEFTNSTNVNSSIINKNVFSNLSIEESFMYLQGEKSFIDFKYLGYSIYSNDKMNYIKGGQGLHEDLKNQVIV